MIKKIIESPWVTIFSGLILLVTSVYETFQKVDAGVGAHHGILVFALVQIIQSIPHLRDAAKDLTGSD